MFVSFTGAQSTGKSTLVSRLIQDKKLVSWKFVPEVTRKVKRNYRVKINEDGDDITQLLILNGHLENYVVHKNDNVVLDRCILDGLVYTHYLYNKDKVSKEVYDYSIFLFDKLWEKLDYVFFLPALFPLENDGERSSNNEFRCDIDLLFQHFINNEIDNKDKVLILDDKDIENRLQIIYNKIYE